MFIRKQTYDTLNQMIDDAISGKFQESDYDETELSKLEVKWKRFLTASKLSSAKVEEEQKQIKELVSDISHQTKTPLANIMLYSQLLKEQELSEEAYNIAEEISIQSKKLEFLIQSLVKISRLETGTFTMAPQMHDVRELVNESIKLAEGSLKTKNICLDIKHNKETVNAVFDYKWTQEAFMNILDNAIKYSPVESIISIETTETQNFACISVSDQGEGISEEEIPLIFKRFYRGKNVSRVEGVGIGLYLSRQLVEEQSGYIKVVSKIGEGSCFKIYLPK